MSEPTQHDIQQLWKALEDMNERIDLIAHRLNQKIDKLDLRADELDRQIKDLDFRIQ